MQFKRPRDFALVACMLCAYAGQSVLANDECEDAIMILPSSANPFATHGATESPEPFIPSQCAGTYFTATGPDVWFIVHLDSIGKILLTTCSAGSFDTDLSLYSGSCGLLTQVACNGDAAQDSSCQPYYSRLVYDVAAPGAYYIRLGGYNGAIGSGLLTSTWYPNKDCDNDGIPDTDEPDCDFDGWPDDCEDDCNDNDIPDDCEFWSDCNSNGVPDECDLSSGTSSDINDNGVLDDCESETIVVPFSLSEEGEECLPDGPLSIPMEGTIIGAHVQFHFTNGGDQSWASDLLLCLQGLEESACLQVGGYNIDCEPGCANILEFPEEWRTTRIGEYACYLPLTPFSMEGEGEYSLDVCHGYKESDEETTWEGSITFLYLNPETPCPGDINNDGIIDGADMGLLIAAWGPCSGECPEDINQDGEVSGADVGQFLANWGPCT